MAIFRISTKFLKNNAGGILDAVRFGGHTFLVIRRSDLMAQIGKAESNINIADIPELEYTKELKKLIP